MPLSDEPLSNATEVIVRVYRPGDLDACRALWAELTETHRELYDDPTIGGDDPGRQFDAHLAATGSDRIWVAEAAGQVIGLAGLLLEGDRAELEPVVVTRSHRGAGVGRLLAAAVIEAARGAGARRLAVRPTGRNAAAIRFLHGIGFDVLGRVELQIELVDRPRRRRERIADRDFLV
jgi:GNAT superfamily N-acetyltransferase